MPRPAADNLVSLARPRSAFMAKLKARYTAVRPPKDSDEARVKSFPVGYTFMQRVRGPRKPGKPSGRSRYDRW